MAAAGGWAAASGGWVAAGGWDGNVELGFGAFVRVREWSAAVLLLSS